MNSCGWSRLSVFLVFGLLFVFAPFGDAWSGRALSIPEFTDPGELAERSEEWQRRPIAHGSWVGKADVVLTLDQHQNAALKETIKKFSTESGLQVVVKEGTCGTSEALLEKKEVDIAGFCCPPSTNDRLPGLRYITLGIAALAILVHRDNPIKSLTTDEIRDIFSGRIKDWSQVSKKSNRDAWSLPIRPIGRLHCSTRPGHWRTILPDENDFSPMLTEVGTVPDMVASVGGYGGAIGYEVLWNKNRFDRQGLVKFIHVNGVSPEDDLAVAAGRYPFYRVESVSLWETAWTRNEAARKLVEFVRGNALALATTYHIVASELLVKGGWRFQGDELVGSP